MLFTSYEFIGFVALLMLVYYVVPKKWQWGVLLLFSYAFYFIANPIYLIYILATTVSTYLIARAIAKNLENQSAYIKLHKEELSKDAKKEYKNHQTSIRKRWVAACIVFNVGILAVLKYTNFAINNVNSILSTFGQEKQLGFVELALPMGISFYTFMAIGYLVDVYRGTVQAEKNPFKFALFISFFPQLIQGPISRFGDMSKTLFSEHKFDAKQVSFGLQRVLWGFFKKLVVADRIFAAVSLIIGDLDTYKGVYAFVGMVFYTIQLYADFTGGIDITIGIAQMLGVRVQENFNLPYFATSLKDYWRRWHITMCLWFKDYVFYPVSTSKGIQKFAKFSRKHFGDKVGKRLPVYVSSFIVWFATGIWHGASWNFIVWGLANFVILMVSEEFEPLYQKFHNKTHLDTKPVYKVFMMARTFMLICVLNMFDCYASVLDTMKAFASMFVTGNFRVLWDGSLLNLGLSVVDYGILVFGIIVMFVVSFLHRKGSVREMITTKPYIFKAALWFGLFVVVLILGAYGIGYDSSQFIYNRF